MHLTHESSIRLERRRRASLRNSVVSGVVQVLLSHIGEREGFAGGTYPPGGNKLPVIFQGGNKRSEREGEIARGKLGTGTTPTYHRDPRIV